MAEIAPSFRTTRHCKPQRHDSDFGRLGKTAEICVFSTALGWMAIVGSAGRLQALSFGHASEDDAWNALVGLCRRGARSRRWDESLMRKLQAYAQGEKQAFLDVAIDWSGYTAFQRAVLEACRRIPWGEVISYGELARRAGHPGAARAVGQCMAANRTPLVIPCHRVVGTDGRLCGYSAHGGLATKRRLLELEGVRWTGTTVNRQAGR